MKGGGGKESFDSLERATPRLYTYAEYCCLAGNSGSYPSFTTETPPFVPRPISNVLHELTCLERREGGKRHGLTDDGPFARGVVALRRGETRSLFGMSTFCFLETDKKPGDKKKKRRGPCSLSAVLGKGRCRRWRNSTSWAPVVVELVSGVSNTEARDSSIPPIPPPTPPLSHHGAEKRTGLGSAMQFCLTLVACSRQLSVLSVATRRRVLLT